MRPSTVTGWTALILGLLLVVSNVWWFYVMFDEAITDSYRRDELTSYQRALNNALTLMPVVSQNAEKAEIVAEAERLLDDDSFEKEGCTWVGGLGFKFDETDRLVHVTYGLVPGVEEDPCFPE